jgi:hypothetical protein
MTVRLANYINLRGVASIKYGEVKGKVKVVPVLFN